MNKQPVGAPISGARTADQSDYRFASEAAAEAWIEAGKPDLEDVTPSSDKGFTKKDINKAG